MNVLNISGASVRITYDFKWEKVQIGSPVSGCASGKMYIRYRIGINRNNYIWKNIIDKLKPRFRMDIQKCKANKHIKQSNSK